MCVAPPRMRSVVKAVESVRKSAVFAGIVPDSRHLKGGGYHVCLAHLEAYDNLGDYSSSRPADRPPKVTKGGEGNSCAYDIGLSRADMIRVHASVRAVHGDKSDPRRKYVNAINCWRGDGEAQRFNFQTGEVSWATPDHKTHVHGDAPRMYVDAGRDQAEADKAGRAHASILCGESKSAWIAREEPRPKPAPGTVTVKAGDTLWSISRASGVAVADLQKWNGLADATIYPKQALRLTAPPVKPRPAPAWVALRWPVAATAYFRPRPDAPRYKTVQRWQAAMKSHGWAIAADGYLGPRSGAVLVAFQRAEGLKVTRVLDKATFVRAFTTKRRGK